MSDLCIDTHQGSRKAPAGDVWQELRDAREADSVSGRLRNAAQVADSITAHEANLSQLFQAIVDAQESTAQAGAGITFELGLLAPSFNQWQREQGQQAVVTMPGMHGVDAVGEAPVPPVTEDNA